MVDTSTAEHAAQRPYQGPKLQVGLFYNQDKKEPRLNTGQVPYEKEKDDLGDGNSGKFYKIKVEPGGLIVDKHGNTNKDAIMLAMKVFKTKGAFKNENEIQKKFYRTSRHENLMIAHGSFCLDEDTFCMIFPLAKCDLYEYLNDPSHFNPPRTNQERLLNIKRMIGVAEGLRELTIRREENIVHGDLNPQNILLCQEEEDNGDFVLKVGDFGEAIAETRAPQTNPERAYFAFLPPEQIDPRSDTYDVWSFGCILLLMLIYNDFGHGQVSLFLDQNTSETENRFFEYKKNVPMMSKRYELKDNVLAYLNRKPDHSNNSSSDLVQHEILKLLRTSVLKPKAKDRMNMAMVLEKLNDIYEIRNHAPAIDLRDVGRITYRSSSQSPDTGYIVFCDEYGDIKWLRAAEKSLVKPKVPPLKENDFIPLDSNACGNSMICHVAFTEPLLTLRFLQVNSEAASIGLFKWIRLKAFGPLSSIALSPNGSLLALILRHDQELEEPQGTRRRGKRSLKLLAVKDLVPPGLLNIPTMGSITSSQLDPDFLSQYDQFRQHEDAIIESAIRSSDATHGFRTSLLQFSANSDYLYHIFNSNSERDPSSVVIKAWRATFDSEGNFQSIDNAAVQSLEVESELRLRPACTSAAIFNSRRGAIVIIDYMQAHVLMWNHDNQIEPQKELKPMPHIKVVLLTDDDQFAVFICEDSATKVRAMKVFAVDTSKPLETPRELTIVNAPSYDIKDSRVCIKVRQRDGCNAQRYLLITSIDGAPRTEIDLESILRS